MRLLLDTHAWVWRLLDPDRISAPAESAISAHGSELFLSPISTWEALVLARKGRLSLRPNAREWVGEALRRSRLTAAPLSHEVALRAEGLTGFASSDPADRFLVATAIEHDLALVTSDGAMRDFGAVTTIW